MARLFIFLQLFRCPYVLAGKGIRHDSEEHCRSGYADASEAAADANVRRRSHGQSQVLDEQLRCHVGTDARGGVAMRIACPHEAAELTDTMLSSFFSCLLGTLEVATGNGVG